MRRFLFFCFIGIKRYFCIDKSLKNFIMLTGKKGLVKHDTALFISHCPTDPS